VRGELLDARGGRGVQLRQRSKERFLFDFVAVAVSTGLPKLVAGIDATTTALIVEGWATLFAAFCLWLIFVLCDDPTTPVADSATVRAAIPTDASDPQALAG
jgi:hypothetical protein